MAIELLHNTQREAAGLTDVRPEVARQRMMEWSQTTVLELGSVSIQGVEVPVSRGRSGGEGIACGGIRAIETVNPGEMVKELSEEMAFKLLINGEPTIEIDGNTYSLVGGKGLIPFNLNTLSLAEQRDVMAQYAQAMEAQEVSSWEYNKAAGDLNTNHLMGDYVNALDDERDPYYLAAATGKPVELGGLEVRKESTGRGVFAATLAALDHHGKESTTAALQGVGAVGLYYLESANEHEPLADGRPRVAVTVISERDGTIRTEDPRGFILSSETKIQLSDPTYTGSKLEVIMKSQDNPDKVSFSNDPNGFYYQPAECRVPAAFGNSINERTIEGMLSDEAGTQLIIEGANNPVTQEADRRLREKGITIVPDIIANAGGVEVSLAEMRRNIEEKNRELHPGIHPELVSREEYEEPVRRDLVENVQRKVRANYEMMRRLGTDNARVAAVATGMARAGVFQL